jgi:regulatory protein
MKKSALEYVLFLLSRRDYAIKEVREKLARKNFNEEESKKVISDLLAKKLLDDERFAKNYCETHNSWGNIKIKFSLIKKGVPEEIIEKTLSEDGEAEKARKAARLWLKRNQNVVPEKKFSRLAGYLSRQGFRWEVAKEVLSELKDGKIL